MVQSIFEIDVFNQVKKMVSFANFLSTININLG